MRTFSFSERKFLGTTALILFCLVFFALFEETSALSPYLQSFIIGLVFFLIIPLIYCKLILKEPFSAIGWQFGENLKGIFWGVLLTAAGLIAVFLLALQFPEFKQEYGFPAIVETSFLWFMLYELLMVPFVLLVYEVFFRGMVQTLWLGHLGLWAVLVQAAFFAGLMYLSQGIGWADVSLVLFAPLAGLIAYQARSVWYSFLASWLFVFLTDILFLSLR